MWIKNEISARKGGWPVFNVSILACFMKTVESFKGEYR